MCHVGLHLMRTERAKATTVCPAGRAYTLQCMVLCVYASVSIDAVSIIKNGAVRSVFYGVDRSASLYIQPCSNVRCSSHRVWFALVLAANPTLTLPSASS